MRGNFRPFLEENVFIGDAKGERGCNLLLLLFPEEGCEEVVETDFTEREEGIVGPDGSYRSLILGELMFALSVTDFTAEAACKSS